MARALVWSPEALEDIEAIAAHIERDSPWDAKAVASKIVETAQAIPEYPELGRAVPEIGDAAIRARVGRIPVACGSAVSSRSLTNPA